MRGAILIVEDNRVNQRVMVQMLRLIGWDIAVANNGQEAVEMVEQREFALVFMDCQMPILDGYAATARIREREAASAGSRRLPIVACTAHALDGERERALAVGMNDFLAKPVSLNQLKDAIARWALLPSGP